VRGASISVSEYFSALIAVPAGKKPHVERRQELGVTEAYGTSELGIEEHERQRRGRMYDEVGLGRTVSTLTRLPSAAHSPVVRRPSTNACSSCVRNVSVIAGVEPAEVATTSRARSMS
jgi:hypothetical protein